MFCPERPEWPGTVIGPQVIIQVGLELTQRGVMERPGRCLLDGAVHPFHLSVGPGVEGLRQPMLDTVAVTDDIEDMWLVGFCPGLLRELHPIVRQHRMDAVRQGLQRIFEEVGGDLPRHLSIQLGMNEPGGPVHGDEQVGLALTRADFTDIDVQVADRVTLERLFLAFLVASPWQLADAVPLVEPVQA
ncbi:hypothetical protein GCM10007159_40300 [Modicisalibacter luteus]|nr:hypothetical protein GCM10007159_40300 [Halomonas lutea]